MVNVPSRVERGQSMIYDAVSVYICMYQLVAVIFVTFNLPFCFYLWLDRTIYSSSWTIYIFVLDSRRD